MYPFPLMTTTTNYLARKEINSHYSTSQHQINDLYKLFCLYSLHLPITASKSQNVQHW